ncbi:MAG: hypothetical protein ABR999_08850 [Methanoregula sp.]|jgi:hypothetical protein|uniref:hypothetical protein n=1 Tax=Methanoregula sp. TaxID=2052170 RepID=UPI003D11DC4F
MVFTPTGVGYALEFSAIIAAFFLFPYCLDIWWTYKLAQERDKIVQDMMKSSIKEYISQAKPPSAADNCCEQSEKTIENLFNAVMANLKEPIEGISGFTRGMIAFAVIFILGIATLLILFATSADSQIVNNIISMLGATLAAVVGFYFGGKTTQDAVNQANVNQTKRSATPATAKQVTQKQDVGPALKTSGIEIGKTSVFENGVWLIQNDLDIFGNWDTNGKNLLETQMDPTSKATYSLYCAIESSIPYGQFEVYIEPMVVHPNGSETRPLINGRQTFIQMIPHPKQNTVYVKDFAWFPQYDNWRQPGEYVLVIRRGYLKYGHANGTMPIWTGSEEFKITLK